MYACVLALFAAVECSNLVRSIKGGVRKRETVWAPFSSVDKRVFTALLSDPFSIVDAWNPLEKRTCDSFEYR
jgi:hypothetical protein